MRNIYLVRRKDSPDYEEHDSYVCYAKDEEEALAIHNYDFTLQYATEDKSAYEKEISSSNFEDIIDKNRQYHYFRKDNVDVILLGKSREQKQSYIICASYNAG